MSTVRKQAKSWNAIVRVQGHPYISKTFKSKTDALCYKYIMLLRIKAGHLKRS